LLLEKGNANAREGEASFPREVGRQAAKRVLRRGIVQESS